MILTDWNNFFAFSARTKKMNTLLKNPSWINNLLLTNTKLESISPSFLDEIKQGLGKFQSSEPLVSIIIPAFNEEFSVLRTLHSLSKNETTYPVEIIVINNNSTDRTQEILDKLNVKSYFQPVAGWGPARQLGLEKSLGKYVLTADADCFYPPQWIQKMTTALLKGNVTCVYGGYSYLGTPQEARWKFLIYESLRNVMLEIRQVKRPYLNARGLNMGFVRELGLKKGYIYRKMRGEDGRMCFELMQHGKILRLRSNVTCVWTLRRTSKGDRGMLFSFLNNALTELARFKHYFTTQAKHDTHASVNSTTTAINFLTKPEKPAVEKKPDVFEPVE
jgi:glycosyltransferase involved in cell wall biosynthesis